MNKASAAVGAESVREAVRRSVLEWKSFRPEEIMAMATEAGIPEPDREQVELYRP